MDNTVDQFTRTQGSININRQTSNSAGRRTIKKTDQTKNQRKRSPDPHEQIVKAKEYFGCSAHAPDQNQQQAQQQDPDKKKTLSYYIQNCSVCMMQMDLHAQQQPKKLHDDAFYKKDEISFPVLIDYLLAPTTDLEGCEVMFPDTVFYQDGKPSYMVKTDLNGKLYKKSQSNQRLDLGTTLKENMAEQRKLTKTVFQYLQQRGFGPQGQTDPLANTMPKCPESPQKSLNRSTMKNGSQNTPVATGGEQVLEENKNKKQMKDNLDCVIFRHIPKRGGEQVVMNDGPSFIDDSRQVRVLKNQDMVSKNFKPGLQYNTKYWQTVEIIQTVGNTRTGTGDPMNVFLVEFYAPLDENEPFADIDYDYKHYKSDYDLLRDGEENDYVQKQILRFCYYIQKVRCYEILSMKAEFFKDLNGFIFFSYAQSINVRTMTNQSAVTTEDAKEKARVLLQSKEIMRKQMVAELDNFERAHPKESKGPAVQKLIEEMGDYYQNLKKEVGLGDKDGLNEDEDELDDLLHALKPNTQPSNFKEFLKKADNRTKTMAWRQISRKMHHKEERKIKKEQEENVGGPFDSANLEVAKLYGAMQVDYRKLNNPTLKNKEGAELKLIEKILHEQYDLKATDLYKRQPQGDAMCYEYNPKNCSQVKAELIRRNLLSRKDLMQLYRPPVKNHLKPSSNPFYNNQLVPRRVSSALVRLPNEVRIQNLTKHVLKPQSKDGSVDMRSISAIQKNNSINTIRQVTKPYSLGKNSMNVSHNQSSAMHADKITRNTVNDPTQGSVLTGDSVRGLNQRVSNQQVAKPPIGNYNSSRFQQRPATGNLMRLQYPLLKPQINQTFLSPNDGIAGSVFSFPENYKSNAFISRRTDSQPRNGSHLQTRTGSVPNGNFYKQQNEYKKVNRSNRPPTMTQKAPMNNSIIQQRQLRGLLSSTNGGSSLMGPSPDISHIGDNARQNSVDTAPVQIIRNTTSNNKIITQPPRQQSDQDYYNN